MLLALRVLLLALVAASLLPAMAIGFVGLLLAIHAGRFPDDVAVLMAFGAVGLVLWLAHLACRTGERAIDRLVARLPCRPA